MVGLIAAITAILAIVGVYGAMALAARRRLKEMGIRLALGAQRADVYHAMVAPNARPVVVGLVVGVLFATGIAIAMVVPARNATAVDPAIVLRQD